eukprot:TRINITY_DN5904_c0_g1_i1.p1 TRINITY_DN5904_c0_g1~~TRINITY_DN5904_c0_g1_i1.p1  ORF type:complete len:2148 (+),score=473.24 TRINITY_DN5904_c0_g1_i1:212-6655(+)
MNDSCPKMVLKLEGGPTYQGYSFGAPRSVAGECVFQTGMTGYVESLTDPSYRGQILILSFPLIGNYGVPPPTLDHHGLPLYFESNKVQVAGLVVASYSFEQSHWNSLQSLSNYLQANNIPAIYGVDTRALIKNIRDKGSTLGQLHLESNKEQIAYNDPNKRNLVQEVSTKEVKCYGEGELDVLVVDCGLKVNQIRCFLSRGARVRVVPWDYNFLGESFDGLFLSNGPGDPTQCAPLVENLKVFLERESKKSSPTPVFGICLGNQILGLAVGAKTYKLKFGNRGQNQPCIDEFSGRCHLTMQNHGYAIDTTTLPKEWKQFFYNANDLTNEGIKHEQFPFFSVQFHPEAKGGPKETEYLFDYFLHLVQCKKQGKKDPFDHPLHKPFNSAPIPKVSKVLILGSGGLSIGQAGEFDYSGSQAIKALKEDRIKTILINPNIATVQTTKGLADKVYFLPITPHYVQKVIELEKPDGLLLQFGGQTALNCGIELYRSGYLSQKSIQVLGTSVASIVKTEDREEFSAALKEIGEKAAPSLSARTLEEAIGAAKSVGYPVIVRAGYALGGLGSGFANDETQLIELVQKALASAEMVLIERSLKGWKEIEYEVVRDAYDNCVTICNMENFDPLGIHTGESIVVAPSQTLSDREYHMLRQVAIKVVRYLGIIGECNIQYALDPHSDEYFIIEVNARLSRSSALASKATGYPLAFVAAKLALGKSLPSLRNAAVTSATTACFEPSLDYVVVKMPRWDLHKFVHVSKNIGTSMKSVGEVMAIGRTFEETISKAIRMVSGSSIHGFESHIFKLPDQIDNIEQYFEEKLSNASHDRIFIIASALSKGLTVDQIHKYTKIDRWFLYKLQNIYQFERKLKNEIKSTHNLTQQIVLEAKQLGFSDNQIARCLNNTELVVRHLRKQFNVLPVVKQIDTVSAEFPAKNNYLYMTYNGTENDIPESSVSQPIMVLGSGAYCIGSSVEFDWCAVSCIRTLSDLGYSTIMVNYNPETVSTDYDECDLLYFEEISFERVVDIYEREMPEGVVVSMGGQIPNNMAMALSRQKIRILGTMPESIDTAENRYKFSRLLDSVNVDQPMWKECRSIADTKEFCRLVGYPCLVRPSFVLSGAGMTVVNTDGELENFLKTAVSVETDVCIVISKFISNAKEIDVDAVAQGGNIVVSAISEHVENAGVHSGDATLILPAQDLDEITINKIKEATSVIAQQLLVSGPFNIQFIAKDDEIKVIECNLRASRSFPFVSKTLGVNFAEVATKVLVNQPQEPIRIDLDAINHVGVKVPQFSFTRLQGADPILGVEMASTGEVACFGKNKYEAYVKGLISTGFELPKLNILISIGQFKEKEEFLPSAIKLSEMGFQLYGTPGTADFLSAKGVPIKALEWPSNTNDDEFSITKHLSTNSMDLCILLPSNNRYRRLASFMSKGYMTRRLAVDFSIPLITNIKNAKLFVESLRVVPRSIPIENYDCITSYKMEILPGLYDSSFHFIENWTTDTSKALSSGFTLICSLIPPPTLLGSSLVEILKSTKRGVFNQALCDFSLFLSGNSLSPTQVQELSYEASGLFIDLSSNLEMANWIDYLNKWPRNKPFCVSSKDPYRLSSMLFLAHLNSRKIHLVDVKGKETWAILKQAKESGVQFTCQVNAFDLYYGTTEDMQSLWDNIHLIDIFSGGYGVLGIMMKAVAEGKLTLSDVVTKMRDNPRDIFHLPEQQNTLVELDMGEEWEFVSEHRTIKTPGKIHRIILNGATVYLDGVVWAKPGSGKNAELHKEPGIVLPRQRDNSPLRTPPLPRTHQQPVKMEVPHTTAPPSHAPPTSLPQIAIAARPRNIQPSKLPARVTLSRSLLKQSILSVSQFDREHLHQIFAIADEMKLMVNRIGRLDICKDFVLATVFYEPSTRTCSSFMAAMERLGGGVVPSFSETSSVVKGESLVDTIRTLEQYVDVIVLRHPQPGSSALAAANCRKPIINAGDGAGEHPTQALLDVYTIRQELGTVNRLHVTIVGDLKHGRTVHSLVKVLSLYEGITFSYVSPKSLCLPRDIYEEINKKGFQQKEIFTVKEFEDIVSHTDVLYVTRIQKERFADPEEYNKTKGIFRITPELLTKAKERMVVMHPLPRVDEISTDVDSDPRAAYFRQMENGMYIRMSLLSLILGRAGL